VASPRLRDLLKTLSLPMLVALGGAGTAVHLKPDCPAMSGTLAVPPVRPAHHTRPSQHGN
jgi:hypothetical protein